MRRSVLGSVTVALLAGVLSVPAAAAEATEPVYDAVVMETPWVKVMDGADGAVVKAETYGTAVSVTASQGTDFVRSTITPPTGQTLAVGTYAVSALAPTSTRARFDSGSCASSNSVGSLQVFEIARDGAGAVTTFAARVTITCYDQPGWFEFRVGSTKPWWGVRTTGNRSVRAFRGATRSLDVTLTGAGPEVAHLGTAAVSSPAPGTFAIASDGCAGAALAPGDACTVTVTVTAPNQLGTTTGRLVIPADSPLGQVDLGLHLETVMPPPAPMNIRAVAGYDGVGVSWDLPYYSWDSKLTGYRVYRDGEAGPLVEVNRSVSSYVDPAAPGETHTYYVVAVEPAGEGPRAAGETATVPAGVPAVAGPLTVLAFDRALGDAATTTFPVTATPGTLTASTTPGGVVTVKPHSGSAWAPGTFSATVTTLSMVGWHECTGTSQVTVTEARVKADGTPLVLAAAIPMPQCDLTVHLRINASTPVVALDTTPDSLAPPETRAGATAAPQTVTVANHGSEPVDLGQATAPAAWTLGDDGCSGTTLAAGASCTLAVTFAPTEWGVHTGTLEIPDSTPRGQRRVALKGTAGGVPTEPVGLTATPMVGRVLLAWTPPAVYPPVAAYTVYRGTSPTSLTSIGTTTASRHMVVNATPGQRLYFAVTAHNARGASGMAYADAVVAGRELHYSADTGDGIYHLWTRTLPGGEAVRPLTNPGDEEDPAISPDGRMLAYTKLVDGRYHLFVTSFDGKTAAKRGGDVNGVPWTYGNPQWSPDGTKLAVSCAPMSQDWYDVCIATPAGVTRLKNGVAAHGPSWLPNGKELLVVTESSPRRVNILAADGSYRYLVPGTDNVRSVAVSPDGSRMAWTRYEVPESGGLGRRTLRVSGLDGGAGRELVSSGFSNDPSWSPDSETIYYTHAPTGTSGVNLVRDVYSVPSTGGTPVRLTNTPGIDEDDVVVNDVVSQRALPYLPRRLQDFNGDGRAEIAIFRPSTGVWRIRGQAAVQFGRAGDYPVAADYTGDRKADMAVYRPSTQTWYVRGVTGSVRWGAPGDLPVPADYNGDGKADIAVFRPSNGGWYVRGRPVVYVGKAGNVPVPADFTGDRKADPAAYVPSSGFWAVAGLGTRYGYHGAVPTPDDYLGAGRAQFSTYTPNVRWNVYGPGGPSFTVPKVTWSLPAYGNVDADRGVEPGVFEPTFGAWLLLGVPVVQWGTTGDLPV